MKLGYDFIFLDESKLELKNNHFRVWRKKEEIITFGINNNAKKNLILAVSKNEIIFYQILDDNINSNIFIEILEKLNDKIERNDNKKIVLILDNCTTHKTDEVIKFLYEKNINTIFTPPYQSTFTAIELAFRAIKKIIYSKLYNEIGELIKDVENILTGESIKETLLLNFRETINQYISFLDLNNDFNLNNIEI